MCGFRHGELHVVNSTHVLWQWHQNQDLAPVVADEFYLVKGEQAALGERVHGEPTFARNRRGREAAALDAEARRSNSARHPDPWRIEENGMAEK